MEFAPCLLTPRCEDRQVTCAQSVQHSTVLLGQSVESWIFLGHVDKEGLEERTRESKQRSNGVAECEEVRKSVQTSSVSADADDEVLVRRVAVAPARGLFADTRTIFGRRGSPCQMPSCMQGSQSSAHLYPQRLTSLGLAQ